MKKIILIFLILANIDVVKAEITDSLFMTVGNKPITQSDLVDEIKILLILNNESYSDDKKDQLHNLAIKSSIKRAVKSIELERNDYFNLNEDDLKNELTRLAKNLFIDLDTLKNICETNELDFSKIEDNIKVELYWNSLIFELYKHNLNINQTEVEDQLKLFQKKKKLNEYLISEIVISKPISENLDLEIEDLRNRIESEGFENVAKEISISESGLNGGDLGWISENIVSEKVKSALMETSKGGLSNPIILQEGILIFKLRDKREIDTKVSLEELKNQLISEEKSKILNMHSISHYDKVRRTITIKYFQ